MPSERRFDKKAMTAFLSEARQRRAQPEPPGSGRGHDGRGSPAPVRDMLECAKGGNDHESTRLLHRPRFSDERA